MNKLWRDPGLRAMTLLVAMILIGFAMLIFSWHKAVDAVYAPLQSPWIISGGLAGVALIGFAMGAWAIQIGRRDDAVARNDFEDFARVTAELAERIKSGDLVLPSRRPAPEPTPAQTRIRKAATRTAGPTAKKATATRTARARKATSAR